MHHDLLQSLPVYRATYVVLLQKQFNLNPIMRKQAEILQNNWTQDPKVAVLKEKKTGSSCRLKETEADVAQMIKNLPAMRDTWVRSPGEGNGYPLQYSHLGNSMDWRAWWATMG